MALRQEYSQGNARIHRDLREIAETEGLGPEIETLSCRSERLLLRAGNVVFKVHAEGTNAEELQTRLRIVSRAPWNAVFLQARDQELRRVAGGRWLTQWPLARPLLIDEDVIPWTECAELLATLHNLPLESETSTLSAYASVPRNRAIARWTAAIRKIRSVSVEKRDADWHRIVGAAATLTLRESEERRTHWVHGDWHLGQVVDIGGDGVPAWRLIDIEDMGVGDPIWDLARPAAFFACGLLPAEEWEEFLAAYRKAGGPAVPRSGDVWGQLEVPARALVVQSAASAWLKAKDESRPLYPDESRLLETCERILKVKQPNG